MRLRFDGGSRTRDLSLNANSDDDAHITPVARHPLDKQRRGAINSRTVIIRRARKKMTDDVRAKSDRPLAVVDDAAGTSRRRQHGGAP